MLQQAHGPWEGAWDVPGGFCDVDEHPIETVKRTTLDEAGLAVRVTGYLGAWLGTFPRTAGSTEQVETLTLCYHAIPEKGATLRIDHTAVREADWFLPSNLPELIAFPGYLRPVLHAWREALRTGLTQTPLMDAPLRTGGTS